VVPGAAAHVEDRLPGAEFQPGHEVLAEHLDPGDILYPVEEPDEHTRIVQLVDRGEHPDVLDLGHGRLLLPGGAPERYRVEAAEPD
jgi:hypothetical protein